MDNEDICTHSKVLLSHKENNEVLPFVSNMDFDLDSIMLSEISLTEKD